MKILSINSYSSELFIFLNVKHYNTASKIQRFCGFGYSWSYLILNFFYNHKLLERRKIGRQMVYNYTKDGFELYRVLKDLEKKLNKVKAEVDIRGARLGS